MNEKHWEDFNKWWSEQEWMTNEASAKAAWKAGRESMREELVMIVLMKQVRSGHHEHGTIGHFRMNMIDLMKELP